MWSKNLFESQNSPFTGLSWTFKVIVYLVRGRVEPRDLVTAEFCLKPQGYGTASRDGGESTVFMWQI